MPKDVRFVIGDSSPQPEGYIDSDYKLLEFHNLRELAAGGETESPAFWCFEHKWKVKLCISEHLGEVGLFLIHCPSSKTHESEGIFNLVLSGAIKNPEIEDGVFKVKSGEDATFGDDYICHKEDLRLGGVILHVSVGMVLHKHDRIINLHAQEYQLRRSLCNALSDADTSDISFDVKGQIVQAHLVMLKAMAPDLVRTLNLEEHDTANPVPISDVEPETFHTMLEYIYGGTVAFTDAEHAKAIINASDKYGVDSLKVAAEESYVDKIVFTVDNVVEVLLYADGKNCCKLKEEAMDFLMRNMDEVLESPSFDNIYESKSLTKEILSKRARHSY